MLERRNREATPTPTDPVAPRARHRGRLTVPAVIAGGLAGLFPSLIIITSLPDIAADLGTSVGVMAWALTGPLLASAIALPASGKLADLWGHRPVFVASVALVAATSACTVFAWSPWSFIALRTLTQIAGVALQPAAVALMNTHAAPERRAHAFGIWALVVAVGPALGLVVGGPLAEAFSWRAVFALQTALAVAALGMALALPRSGRPTGDRTRFDAPGAALLGVTALGVVIALDQGLELGWSHPVVAGGVLTAALGATAFAIVERRVSDPLIPGRLVAEPAFSAAVAAQFFTQATSMGTIAVVPLIMRSQLGLSSSASSFLMLTMPVSFALAAPLGSRLAAASHGAHPALVGTLTMSAGTLTLAAATRTTSVLFVTGSMLVIGAGAGLCKPGYTLAVATSGGQDDVGIAVATERMLAQIGSTLGIASLLAVAEGGHRSGFTAAALVATGYTLAATAVALVLARGRFRPAGRRPPTHGPAPRAE